VLPPIVTLVPDGIPRVISRALTASGALVMAETLK
jgi:hypothetical protein